MTNQKIVAQILIIDGLGFPSGFVAKSPKKCVIFCRMPIDWTENGKVKWEKYDLFFEELYGKNWQFGNEDGSRYVVEKVNSRILSPEENARQPWKTMANNDEYLFWHYAVSDDGELLKVSPSEL
jgi:hypothetical protein